MARTLAIFGCFYLLGQAPERKEVVAWVTQCEGDWEDHAVADHPVRIPCTGVRGELWFQLLRDSKLAASSHKSRQWINVRIARTGEKHHFDCEKPGECYPPFLPFAKLVPNEKNAGILELFLESPGNSYSRARLLLSRSETTDSGRVTADHVVISANSPVALRDLLRPATAQGTYLLELCPFDEKSGCPSTAKPYSVNWPRDSSAMWPKGVDLGLYEIVLNKVVNGVTMRTADRGLLLVAPEKSVASVRSKIEAGEQLFLDDWVNKSEGRLMFKALLIDLAQPASR
jgi:hypothetical protein